MKNFVLGFVSALIFVGLIYGVLALSPGLGKEKQGPLYDEDVKKAEEAVLCDSVKHSCSYFDKVDDSGNLRVVISAGEVLLENLEVDVASKPGSPQYYVKLTNKQGVSLFDNLPSGKYVIYFNGTNFPKEYGDSPTAPAEIIKNQTTERKIDLSPK